MVSFLTQALPLVVFLLVDALVDDARWSILAAVAFAVLQLVVTWRATRRFDWFVLVDVGLIAGLGGVSLALDDALFFKLKPAVMEGASVVFLGVLLLLPPAFLARYVGRLTPGRALPPEALRLMRGLLAGAATLTALHAGAVVAAAVWASKETWALVSGPGFYVALAPLLGFAWWRGRRARGG